MRVVWSGRSELLNHPAMYVDGAAIRRRSCEATCRLSNTLPSSAKGAGHGNIQRRIPVREPAAGG